MLRWRLVIGTVGIAALVALAWLDYRAAIPGTWLGPAILVLAVLATRELLNLCAASGLRPIALTVYAGNVLVLASPWFPLLGRIVAGHAVHGSDLANLAAKNGLGPGEWTLVALAIAVLVAFVGEMARYRQPGQVIANLAAAVFSVAYLGLLPSFAVRLRLDWGIGAFASLVIVVKMGDTGAYLFGKLFGRRKLAPLLSPNKTVEGAIGGLCFSLLGAWAAAFLVVALAAPEATERATIVSPFWGWSLFALLVGAAGMLGDLAESLLKRGSGARNSSKWMPGLGGILDLLDSILIAAPVAYVLWRVGVVG